ncbi:LAQU0S16e02542g1_1 [Lachancea quebecensis]|uniref:Mediator of RNA polymerase II transcription subunit 8 n=1 Tax=Lachancea quebecensis TaxID=1654605 RepID=A0A0P1KWB2_9SACH|nr:LAQU0S16e02542g1_1 [Lachancea quebecensis]
MSQGSVPGAGVGVSDPQADYNFSHVPAQALDAVRMRLAQLTHSQAKLKDEMAKADLPQWHSLQAQVSIILTQLQSLTSTIHHFEETLDSTVVYPLANFPTTAHEGLLTTLLRKKNIPEVDEWINDAKETSGIDINTASHEDIKNALRSDEELTKWALDFLKQEHSNYSYHGFHTARELSAGAPPNTRDEYQRAPSSKKPKKPFDANSVLKMIHQGTFN